MMSRTARRRIARQKISAKTWRRLQNICRLKARVRRVEILVSEGIKPRDHYGKFLSLGGLRSKLAALVGFAH